MAQQAHKFHHINTYILNKSTYAHANMFYTYITVHKYIIALYVCKHALKRYAYVL